MIALSMPRLSSARLTAAEPLALHHHNQFALLLQAVQKMHPGAGSEPMDQRSSAKLVEAMEKEGYLPTVKANLELTESLEKIKVS